MLIIFNWITIQSIILHSILFSYGSVHICGNSNKLSRVTSQSKVENKMAPYRTAAMIFTAILDLEARRKVKKLSRLQEEKYAIWNSNNGSEKVFGYLWPFLGLFCPIWVSCCAWCLTHVAPPLHSIIEAIKSLVSLNHHVPAILFNHAL